MKYKRLQMSKPIAVKLDQPLLDRIKALSERIGEAQSTVMRMAMRIGLDGLEKAFEANPADFLKLVSRIESVNPPGASYPEHGGQASRVEDKPAALKPQLSSKPNHGRELLRIIKKHHPKAGGSAPPGAKQ
ncbi:MAG: hypothetical protein KGL39_28790 [Patescibacteria group bacterium]|nr:hypothetical protein [Patescibacteria group bacterium]